MLQRLCLGLLLGAAIGNFAWAQGSSAFDGEYTGRLTLKKVISGDCTKPPLGAIYPLTVSRGQVQFKYVPRFDTTLNGTVDANGRFKASRRVPKGVVSMDGQIRFNDVTATIRSPSCEYTFQTKN
jgi:hypothetical protein